MKKRNLKYRSGMLALICGLVLTISCHPEYEPELVKYPDITVGDYSPSTGYPGSVVTITGENFGTYSQAARISFGGVRATEFVSYTDDRIEVRVPLLAQPGKLSVQIWNHLRDSLGNYTVVALPVIEEVESSSQFGSNIAFPGDIITIKGTGFGTSAAALSISIGGVVAEIISPVLDTEVRIVAPEEFPTGNVELTIGGATIVGQPAMINPAAGGDITPYFLGNTGLQPQGAFVRNADALSGNRWGTMGAPWISNDGIKNKINASSIKVGGFAREQWTAPEGYICFESWGDTPITDGKLYQKTSMELPAGEYTFSVNYYSEVVTNSTVHIVAAAGDGLPSLPELGTAIASVEGWNDTPVGATSPSITETKELNFTLDVSQTVSLGFLVNMKGAASKAGYFKIHWVRLVKK